MSGRKIESEPGESGGESALMMDALLKMGIIEFANLRRQIAADFAQVERANGIRDTGLDQRVIMDEEAEKNRLRKMSLEELEAEKSDLVFQTWLSEEDRIRRSAVLQSVIDEKKAASQPE
jgi:hypothetical protein